MTNEQIKDIKLALECCADEVDGYPKCPYARKNSADGIAHCRQAFLDALQLINEYEQRIAQLESELSRYQGGGDKRIALTNETRKNTAYDFYLHSVSSKTYRRKLVKYSTRCLRYMA